MNPYYNPFYTGYYYPLQGPLALPNPSPNPSPNPQPDLNLIHSNLIPSVPEFVIDEYKDLSLPWYTDKIKSYEAYTLEFKLVDKINNGGQGEIYLTKSMITNKLSLITKIYKYTNNFKKNQIIQEYLLIRSCAFLCYGALHYGKNDDEIYIVMDILRCTLKYCIKYNFEQELHDFKCVHNDLNFKYFILEIASILYKLHKRNHIHLDIKPSNIMFRNNNCDEVLTYGNGWKLIDFGISKYLHPYCNPKYIKLNRYRGTVGWSAPEMSPFNKANFVSRNTDIFSFGLVILYVINRKNIFAVDKNDKNDFYYNKLHGNDPNKFTKKITQHLLNLKINNLICSDLHNLLGKMLVYDQDQRIPAIKILNHNWFKGLLRKNKNNIYLKRNKTRIVSKNRPSQEWLCIS